MQAFYREAHWQANAELGAVVRATPLKLVLLQPTNFTL
jgi:hypothetical protein